MVLVEKLFLVLAMILEKLLELKKKRHLKLLMQLQMQYLIVVNLQLFPIFI